MNLQERQREMRERALVVNPKEVSQQGQAKSYISGETFGYRTTKAFVMRYEEVRALLLVLPRLTYREIGDRMGLTPQRVQQINSKLGEYGRGKYKAKYNTYTRKQKTYPTKNQAPVEWQAYSNAKARCNNPKHQSFHRYGGRGIEFKFKNFQEFWECLGSKPKGLTLERIDNNGHYEVGNVEWATYAKQALNRRHRMSK